MSKVYFLTWTRSKIVAKGNTGNNDPAFMMESDIIKNEKVSFDFILDSEISEDYLGNTLAWPLMSSTMKKVIDDNTSAKEGIKWLEVIVNQPHKTVVYYLLTFIKKNDVLDTSKTYYAPNSDFVVKPVFEVNLIKEINIFTKGNNHSWQITAGLFVTERLKKALQKSNLTGIKFERAATNEAI